MIRDTRTSAFYSGSLAACCLAVTLACAVARGQRTDPLPSALEDDRQPQGSYDSVGKDGGGRIRGRLIRERVWRLSLSEDSQPDQCQG